jgi:hypothetical protein
MTRQAFSWQEIMDQAMKSQVAERLQPAIEWTGEATREGLELISVFLTPIALMEAALGSWRLGADLGFTGDFFISTGLFSHWQVWFALALGTQFLSLTLGRYLRNLPEQPQKGQ